MIFILIAAVVVMTIILSRYNKEAYKNASGYNYFKMQMNPNNRFQYKIYKALEKVHGFSKINLNVQIPREDQKDIAIDILFIHETGLYVMDTKSEFLKAQWQEDSYKDALINHLPYIKKERIYFLTVQRTSNKNLHFLMPNVAVINVQELSKFLNKKILNKLNCLKETKVIELHHILEKERAI